MTRNEKIKLLQSISEGKLSVESLQPPQVYIFTESHETPGVYIHNGKEYNETEYREFCERIGSKKNNLRIWDNSKGYPNEDVIITIKHQPAAPDPKRLTLNL